MNYLFDWTKEKKTLGQIQTQFRNNFVVLGKCNWSLNIQFWSHEFVIIKEARRINVRFLNTWTLARVPFWHLGILHDVMLFDITLNHLTQSCLINALLYLMFIVIGCTVMNDNRLIQHRKQNKETKRRYYNNQTPVRTNETKIGITGSYTEVNPSFSFWLNHVKILKSYRLLSWRLHLIAWH